jgi:alkylhydroperoxidase family enzyme
MHSKDLRAMGEDELRIDLVREWFEAPCYSDRERAAFAWAESVTKLRDTHVPDSVFALARKYFTEDELVKLTLAIVTITGWNTFAISFRSEAGVYQPAQKKTQKPRSAA